MWRYVLFDLGDTLVDNHPVAPEERDEHIAQELAIWLRRRSMRAGDEFSPDERAHLAEIDTGPLVAAVNEGLADAALKYWPGGREAPTDEVFGKLQSELAAAMGLVASLNELEEVYVRARMARQRLLAGAPELLAALRAAGIKCGLVSNTAFSREAMDAYLRTHGLATAFDTVVYSSEIGWRKPRAQVFRAALLRLGAVPGQTAFVGDDPQADVAGAINAGIAGLWVWGNHPAAEQAAEAVSGPVASMAGGAEGPLPGIWPDPTGYPGLAPLITSVVSLASTGRLVGAARTLEQTGKLLLRS